MTKHTAKPKTRLTKKDGGGTSQLPRSRKLHERVFESDGTYFLKLVHVFLLGTFWLKFTEPLQWGGLVFTALPVGLFVGFLLVRAFERHQADRKIWYALLIVVTVITHMQPAGIVI